MEHRIAHRKLNRPTAHRLAMLRNMVTSLLRHESIVTTVAKAKDAKRMAEQVITLGKRGGLHNVRQAQRVVRDRDVLHKLFSDLKERYASRPGGYARILRKGFRKGDGAELALLELVDKKTDAAEPPAT